MNGKQIFFAELKKHIALSEEEKDIIIPYLKEFSFKRGEFILEAGYVANHLHFIVDGVVRVYYYEDGQEICTYFACDNGFTTGFGSFITRKPSHEYIECLMPTTTLAISNADMQILYNKLTKWEKVGRILSEQNYLCMLERSRILQTKVAKDRYIDFVQNADSKILQHVPQKLIASYLGIAPESLSRIRKEIASF